MEEESTNKTINYQSDSPIHNPDQDLFGRWPYAKRIAETIINRTDPSSIVIGIYGPWGDGKSSMINLINHELKLYPDKIIPIFFNPWRIKDETQLIMSFFAHLSSNLDKKKKINGERIGQLLDKYAEICIPVDVGVPGVGINVGKIVKNFGKLISNNNPDKLKDKINRALKKSKKRIVIFMDDIDRLDKAEIHAIFKLVKLTAGFNNICYILAFDDQMVATALTERYGKDSSDIDAGYSFLEKIIQIPIRSPQIPRLALLEFFELELLKVLSDSEISFTKQMLQPFWRIVLNDLYVSITTPRICKRYSNVIRFATTVLKGEINLGDLLLIEAIRIFYPQLYDAIKNNQNLFLGTGGFLESKEVLQKRAQDTTKEALEPYTDSEKASAKSIISYLFPKTAAFREELHKEKRIASGDYFQRYFSYSVPKDDVSDNRIDNFITSISKLEVEDIVKELHSIIDKKNVNKVLFKLMPYKDKVRNNNSLKLSKALSEIGDLLPTSSESTFVRSPQYLASSLIHDLLLNAKTEYAFYSTIMDIIEKSEPVTYSLKCFYEITNDDKSKPDKSLLSDIQIKELNALLLSRIIDIASSKILYAEYGKEAEGLIWHWYRWGDKEKLKDYLQSTFKKDKNNILSFLSVFVTIGEDIHGIISEKGLRRETFDQILKLVNPQYVYTQLKSIYGDKIDNAKKAWQYEVNDIDHKEKVASQFAAFYNAMLKEKESITNPDENKNNKENVK